MKAVIYHCSDIKDYEAESKINELKDFCTIRGFEIVNVYNEKIASDGRQRPLFNQMLKDANKRKFDIVVVWSYNNFRRTSEMTDLKHIVDLYDNGIFFISYKEPFLDTLSNRSSILMPLLNWLVAEQAKTISQRTKQGIQNAKKKGIKIGRPKAKIDVEKAISLRKEGKTLIEIANILGSSKETVRRALMKFKEQNQE